MPLLQSMHLKKSSKDEYKILAAKAKAGVTFIPWPSMPTPLTCTLSFWVNLPFWSGNTSGVHSSIPKNIVADSILLPLSTLRVIALLLFLLRFWIKCFTDALIWSEIKVKRSNSLSLTKQKQYQLFFYTRLISVQRWRICQTRFLSKKYFNQHK